MLKQSIGMTENNAKQIAEMYLSRYNPTYWDGSGKVPFEVIFEICRVAVDSMYNGCTLDIQLCKIDACPCYAASIHLFEGGFWTGHGIGCFDKTALCYDIGSVHSLASAIMRICATYENLTNFRKVFVERLVISKERMNEIKQYTDGGKKQDEIEFESVTFADGMCMDVRCVPRKDGPRLLFITRTKMLSHPSRTIRSTITGSARRQTPPTISICALPIPSDG